MILDLTKISIYVRPGRTDMRKQINGLSVMVETEMKKNPFSGSLFLFCNRGRKLLKAIYWDRNGFCMWQKRLEKQKFPWPKTEEEAREISLNELKMVLNGINFWEAHTEERYKHVG